VALSQRQRSSAAPLVLVYAALVLYASLYPFAGWRWPPGPSLGALLVLPWPPWRDPFDVWSNVLGYMPLGGLLYVAQVRGGHAAWKAALGALLAASALSYLTEVIQQFLPGRVPSRVDWALNSVGAAAGAAMAAVLQALGLLQRWQALRERWFVRDSAGGLSLLALWPIGLLFPTPVPLAVGHLANELRDALLALFEDATWARGFVELLHGVGLGAQPLPPLSDALVQLLGLLAPCLVAFSVTQHGQRRAERQGWQRLRRRPGQCAGLADAADAASPGVRRGAGRGLRAARGARRRRTGLGSAGRAGGAGQPGAGRPVLCRQLAELGAGPFHPLPWAGAVDWLVVALCGDGLAAEPAGPARCGLMDGAQAPGSAGRAAYNS